MVGRVAAGRSRPQSRDARSREVRRSGSTCEPAEQCRRAGWRRWWREGTGQGEHGQRNAPRTQRRGSAPKCSGSCAPSSSKDKDARFTALLHHVDVDRLRAAYWALSPRPRRGSTASRGTTTGRISREPRIFTPGSIAGATERGRLGACASRKRTGGCGRSGSRRWRTSPPAGARRGVERDLRAGLSRVLVWVPAGTRPHDALDALASGSSRGR